MNGPNDAWTDQSSLLATKVSPCRARSLEFVRSSSRVRRSARAKSGEPRALVRSRPHVFATVDPLAAAALSAPRLFPRLSRALFASEARILHPPLSRQAGRARERRWNERLSCPRSVRMPRRVVTSRTTGASVSSRAAPSVLDDEECDVQLASSRRALRFSPLVTPSLFLPSRKTLRVPWIATNSSSVVIREREEGIRKVGSDRAAAHFVSLFFVAKLARTLLELEREQVYSCELGERGVKRVKEN